MTPTALFNRDYLDLTTKVAEECQSSFLGGDAARFLERLQQTIIALQ